MQGISYLTLVKGSSDAQKVTTQPPALVPSALRAQYNNHSYLPRISHETGYCSLSKSRAIILNYVLSQALCSRVMHVYMYIVVINASNRKYIKCNLINTHLAL